MKLIRRFSAIITLFALFSTLTACSFFTPYKAPITQGTVIDTESLNSLQEGLTAQQVVELLGPPFGQDPFNANRWSYVFYTTEPDFQPDAVKHLWVAFDQQGYLLDWKVKEKAVEVDRGFDDGLGLFD